MSTDLAKYLDIAQEFVDSGQSTDSISVPKVSNKAESIPDVQVTINEVAEITNQYLEIHFATILDEIHESTVKLQEGFNDILNEDDYSRYEQEIGKLKGYLNKLHKNRLDLTKPLEDAKKLAIAFVKKKRENPDSLIKKIQAKMSSFLKRSQAERLQAWKIHKDSIESKELSPIDKVNSFFEAEQLFSNHELGSKKEKYVAKMLEMPFSQYFKFFPRLVSLFLKNGGSPKELFELLIKKVPERTAIEGLSWDKVVETSVRAKKV